MSNPHPQTIQAFRNGAVLRDSGEEEKQRRIQDYVNAIKHNVTGDSENTTGFTDYKTGAQKDVSGKSRVDLVTPEMVTALGDVLAYGTVKYAARNWEKGIPLMTSYAAAMRHMLKWAAGVDKDDESGLQHIEQAMLNLGMIVTQTRRGRVDLDDRPTSIKGE